VEASLPRTASTTPWHGPPGLWTHLAVAGAALAGAAIGTGCMLVGAAFAADLWHLVDLSLIRIRRKICGVGARPVRVWMDGCFDLFHYGHANALRQARALGDELIVGINMDEEIKQIKGPPVMNDWERQTMVASVKWVDKVVTDVPYMMTPEYLEMIMTKYQIDFVVHGDDPCLMPDGSDVYAHVKKIGKYREVKRTEGVSSTDIVGRMLLCARSTVNRFGKDLFTSSGTIARELRPDGAHISDDEYLRPSGASNESAMKSYAQADRPGDVKGDDHPLGAVGEHLRNKVDSIYSEHSGTSIRVAAGNIEGLMQISSEDRGVNPAPVESGKVEAGTGSLDQSTPETQSFTNCLTTSYRVMQFSNRRQAGQADRVVYTSGTFDLFDVTHVEALRKARTKGDFLLVGIYSDETIADHRGPHYPVMKLQERVLSVLACRYVDEVIMGAPLVVTDEMVKSLNISVVVRSPISLPCEDYSVDDPFSIPTARGILEDVELETMSEDRGVIKRILANYGSFEQKYAKKSKKERDYVKLKEFVQEL